MGRSVLRDYNRSVKRRLTSAFLIFAYFTAVGLMFFGYHYLEDGRELTWTRRFRAGRAASSLRQARSSR